MNKKIENWHQAQKDGTVLPCPRCGGEMNPVLAYNALSRRASIYVCEKCGINEAIEDARQAMNHEFIKLPLSHWYMNLIDTE